MIGFIARCWHWASSLDWWERGVVGALVGAFLFILVPAAISYGAAASFVAHYWSVFSSLDLWQWAAIGDSLGCLVDPDSRLRI
jgi:hypothetical protein